jgi:hypothetical protein
MESGGLLLKTMQDRQDYFLDNIDILPVIG